MASKTSLELILEAHGITRHSFLKSMGVSYKDNLDTLWYGKFSGKRKVTQAELDLIAETLKNLGIREKISYLTDKFTLV